MILWRRKAVKVLKQWIWAISEERFFFSAKHERRCGYIYIYIYIYIYSAKHERRCGYRYIYIYIYILMLMVFKEPNVTAK